MYCSWKGKIAYKVTGHEQNWISEHECSKVVEEISIFNKHSLKWIWKLHIWMLKRTISTDVILSSQALLRRCSESAILQVHHRTEGQASPIWKEVHHVTNTSQSFLLTKSGWIYYYSCNLDCICFCNCLTLSSFYFPVQGNWHWFQK